MVVRIVDPICCMNTWQEGFHLWANLFKHLPNSHIVPTFLSLCTMRVRSHPHTHKKAKETTTFAFSPHFFMVEELRIIFWVVTHFSGNYLKTFRIWCNTMKEDSCAKNLWLKKIAFISKIWIRIHVNI